LYIRLRLQCGDAISEERNPFGIIVQRLQFLPALKKLTILSRLDPRGMSALINYLKDQNVSRRLLKLKLSTGLVMTIGGTEVIDAVGNHDSICKLTILRPEGIGEALRKGICANIGLALTRNKHLVALHLRRCGLWTDSLSALVPSISCPHLTRLKLDGNSLGYLAGTFFCEALDSLLGKLPNLVALHLGNNQLDPIQIGGLASSLTRHKLPLTNLTIGSNDAGDTGLGHLVKALPSSIRQLYLHGIDCTDFGINHICEGLPKWPYLWGLGLNGNPVSDVCNRNNSMN
jgi:hypothetical protein